MNDDERRCQIPVNVSKNKEHDTVTKKLKEKKRIKEKENKLKE